MSNVSPANQHTGDEREQKCWDFYIQGIPNGTQNAYQAAIDAGYSEDHSRNITMQGWFKARLDKLRRKDMLSKAERNLDKVLDFQMVDDEGKVNPQVTSIVVGVSTTVAKTLGKEDGYSERTEVTGKDGANIMENTFTDEEKDALLSLLK